MNRFSKKIKVKAIRFISMMLITVFLLSGHAEAVSYIMTFCFAGTTSIYQTSLAATDGVINTLSPSCFDLNEDGTVTIHSLSKSFVDAMHAEGLEVTPFLSNHWLKEPGNACLNNIESVTNTLRDAVLQYNLDGINVDIQNVNETYRDKYTLFVKTLREKLPNKKITVAVAANPKGWTLGWHGSYDYANLARYSDYLMIMAYDESYYASEPGPVASATFVEDSIKYALKHTTPDKIVVGVPFFGRYWKNGESVGGNGIAMKDVETIIKQYPDAKVTYDNASQSVCVQVTLTSSFKLWGGNTLSAGTYTIWYDNLQSLRYKIELINKYELMGLGSWALGQENTDFWLMCREYLNNPVYSDITGHWAEDAILFCYEQGWMVGGSSGKFRPDSGLTRAEMAIILVRLCDLEEGVPGTPFKDTANHWAGNYIAIARNYGLVHGKGNDYYGPDDLITREEMAVILDRILVLAGGIDFYDNPYSDVSLEKNTWSYYSIIKMTGNQIFTGYHDGTFRPYKSMTRAEIAMTLQNSAGYGINVGEPNQNFSLYSSDGYNEEGQSPR